MRTIHPGPRRAVGLTVTLLMSALVLAGCGGTSVQEGETSAIATDASTSLVPAAEGTTDYPLTLKTPFGESTLEKRPERVVALSLDGTDAELLASLDVVPVFASENIDQPFIPDDIKSRVETTQSWDYDTPPYEAIAAAQPDLIVAYQDDLSKEQYDKLSAIAPVRTGTESKVDTAPWQEKIQLIADSLDLSQDGKQVVNGYSSYMAGLKEKYPKMKGSTLSFTMFFGAKGGTMLLSTPNSTYFAPFEELGFKLPEGADQFDDIQTLSDEQIGLIDADAAIMGFNSSDSANAIDAFRNSALIQAVPVVKDHRYVELMDDPNSFNADGRLEQAAWALAMSGPLSTPWALDAVVPRVAEKLS